MDHQFLMMGNNHFMCFVKGKLSNFYVGFFQRRVIDEGRVIRVLDLPFSPIFISPAAIVHL